ncbi:ATP-binding protein [Luteipulveratus flavus]|uniref:BTAD domain-containing putative transcriptional regulator n=1 Tax=Luteipulveratus flavus TaxID=3031728 RepID=A0ABT6C956_9MICO|nr:BTAD domain-containing putative transcriptional regulator [Luteipulveratus sp. YIM 133296]MDF8265425.1 BTAD domain-containing putative transcriptional regulator [Luteipulveratus sp. YIM 133296]
MTAALTLLTRVAYQDAEIESPQLRHLLALLARDLRTGVSIHRLVDGLWPQDQPANPPKAVQVLVSRARSQLGHDTIVSTPTGYRLSLEPDQVDIADAERCATAASRAARDGDADAAQAYAEAGLAYWNGSAPGGDGSDGALAQVRDEAQSTYDTLCRVHAIALSRAGEHDRALPALLALLQDRPRDEELLAALLRSEAAVSGPAKALERYESYRRSLRDRLGADPGPALTQVHRELLSSDAPQVRTGIPHDPNPLLGRQADVAAVTRLVGTTRVTSIVGAGGLGKTRLAYVVSRGAPQRIVHLVGLAGVSADDGVLGEIASVLGVRDPRLRTTTLRLAAARDVVTGIVEALEPGPALLVLDNCEHVIDGVAEVVQSLISLSPDLRILTTSRAPLGISSEAVYLLPELDDRTSVDLFVQRARAARPDVELPEHEVEALCAHLDGLPLAVELAAARTRVMSVAEIEQRLTDRFALLRGGPRDAPERHRTLQAVIDWSWNLLDERDQSALAALSVFPDGFTREAADHVLGASDATLEILEQLIGQSLLKVYDAPRTTRFRMLETVREFGAVQLERQHRTAPVRAAYLDWAAAYGEVQAWTMFGPDQIAATTLVRTEQDNLLAALRMALEHEDARRVTPIFAALAGLWTAESNHNRVVAVAPEVAWVLSHDVPDETEVDTRRLALVLCATNTLMLSRLTATRSLAALKRLPPAEPGTLMSAFSTLLLNLREILQPDSPVLLAFVRSDDAVLGAAASSMAGQLWENEGRVAEALEMSRAAAVRLRDIDALSPWLISSQRVSLAELSAHVGDYDAAVRNALEALPTLEQLGAWSDVKQLRWNLVLASLQLGEVAEAERWFDEASAQPAEDPFGLGTLSAGVRAEIDLVKGDVEAGLLAWRTVVDRVASGLHDFFITDPPGLEPWTVATESVALAAHARAYRLDQVPGLVDHLIEKIRLLLSSPLQEQHAAFLDFPVTGCAIRAVGASLLDPAYDDEQAAFGARLVALAERFAYPRTHPSMTHPFAQERARERSRSAYDEAVSSYADLTPTAAAGVALELVQTCRR